MVRSSERAGGALAHVRVYTYVHFRVGFKYINFQFAVRAWRSFVSACDNYAIDIGRFITFQSFECALTSVADETRACFLCVAEFCQSLATEREREREGEGGGREKALALALSALIHSSIIDIGFARATLRRYRNVKLIRFARKRCIRRISITMLTDAKPEYYSSIVPSAGKERLMGSDLPAHNCFQIVG